MARRRFRRSLVIVLSLLVSLAAAEGVLVWLDWFDPPVFVASNEFGYLMRPSQSVSTRGLRFRINSAGLRGQEVPAARTTGTYRVAFLGDSVTYGGGSVGDGDIFPVRLGLLLANRLGRPVETVTIAAPGWGLQNMSAFVRSRGTFDSDLVVWVVPAIGFRRPFSRVEYHSFPTERRPLRLQYVYLLARHYLALRIGNSPAYQPENADTLEALRQNVAALKNLLADWRDRGIRSAVLFVPSRDGYEEPGDLEQYSGAVAECAVTQVNAEGVLRTSPESNFFDAIHLSARGHAAAAELLEPVLAAALASGVTPVAPGVSPRINSCAASRAS